MHIVSKHVARPDSQKVPLTGSHVSPAATTVDPAGIAQRLLAEQM